MITLLLLAILQFTVPQHSGALASSGGGGCTFPLTPDITGSGSLSNPPWTQSSATITLTPIVRASGVLSPSTSGTEGIVTYTGCTFPASTSIQAAVNFSGGYFDAIGFMTVAGNGVVYSPDGGDIYSVSNGGVTALSRSCAGESSGDTFLMAYASGVYTVTDVTHSGAFVCNYTASFTSGATPGVLMYYPGGTAPTIGSVVLD